MESVMYQSERQFRIKRPENNHYRPIQTTPLRTPLQKFSDQPWRNVYQVFL